MTDDSGHRRAILVVGVEELLYELIQCFQADRYQILYAAGEEEAARIAARDPLDLLILPLDSLEGKPPPWLGQLRGSGVPVLGVSDQWVPDPEELPSALVDRAVCLLDRPAATDAALELLGERRLLPRVTADLVLQFEGGGRARVKDLSSSSLLVETADPPEAGSACRCELRCGPEAVTFEANVFRVSSERPARVVLQIDRRTPASHSFDRMVRRKLEVRHHELAGPEPGRRGPVAWQVARRAERSLRQSKDLKEVSAPQNGDRPPKGLAARYEVRTRRGRWGVGDIFTAVERSRDRKVCLKVLAEDLRNNALARARLEMEARAGGELADLEGVADVLDFGSDGDGGLYYAMQELEGVSLAQAVAGGQRFGARDAAAIGAHIADTLVVAAERGFGHYDLCPENIVLNRRPGGLLRPVLVNFATDVPHAPARETLARGSQYWPPEAPKVPLNEAHDAYALCALLRDVHEEQNNHGKVPSAMTARRRFRRLLEQGTASAPAERYWDLKSLARDLRRCSNALQAAIAEPPTRVSPPPKVPSWLTPEEAEVLFEALRTDPEMAAQAAGPSTASSSRRRRVAAWSGVAAAGVAILLALWQPWVANGTERPDAETALQAEPTQALAEPTPTSVGRSAPATQPTPDAPLPREEPTDGELGETASPPESQPAAAKRGSKIRKRRISRRRRFVAYLRLARWLLDHGQSVPARRFLTKALKYGDSGRLRHLFARSYSEMGSPWAAIHHQRRAVALAPRSWRYHLQLGRLYISVGQQREACLAFLAALARNPNHPHIDAHHRRHCPPIRSMLR